MRFGGSIRRLLGRRTPDERAASEQAIHEITQARLTREAYGRVPTGTPAVLPTAPPPLPGDHPRRS